MGKAAKTSVLWLALLLVLCSSYALVRPAEVSDPLAGPWTVDGVALGTPASALSHKRFDKGDVTDYLRWSGPSLGHFEHQRLDVSRQDGVLCANGRILRQGRQIVVQVGQSVDRVGRFLPEAPEIEGKWGARSPSYCRVYYRDGIQIRITAVNDDFIRTYIPPANRAGELGKVWGVEVSVPNWRERTIEHSRRARKSKRPRVMGR